ncbi:hypothetical protein PPL_04514 [Heterostelium album PN500]|uniref:Uncharacterized protein n=1 Tax=Heterostelium pallidum (strain ATCC 26659 / Pp 5 / PN500) TaxID=670386 RepID=D3B7S6_HETP5|nr:hypothetical protein PPL_04514 [Heterostelium album PN500]EFA82819.1 hypothetical protein PPL_04514 [Heterostelium album PN500]|eukprot:XP_020434936.1 hypothetical protein PPL_04514 [Heterostelium album PN500]
MEQIDLANHLLLFNSELETLVKLNDSYSQDLKSSEQSLQITKELLDKEIDKNNKLINQLEHYKQQLDNGNSNNISNSNNNISNYSHDQVEQANHSINTNNFQNIEINQQQQPASNNNNSYNYKEESGEEVEILKDRYNNVYSELTNSLLKIESLEIAYSDLDKSLNERSEGSKQTIARLESELSVALAQLAVKDNELSEMHRMHAQESSAQSRDLIESYHKMKEEYESMIEQINSEHNTALERMNAQSTEKSSQVTDQLSRVQSDNSELQKRIDQLQQDLEKFKDDCEFLTIENQQNTRDLEQSKEVNRQWKEKFDKVGDERAEIERLANDNLEEVKRSAAKEKLAADEQCQKLREQLELAGQLREDEITKRLADSLDKLEQQKNKEIEVYKGGAVEIVRLTEQLEQSQKQLQQTNQQYQQLQNNFKQMENNAQLRIEALQTDKDSLENQLDQLGNRIKIMDQQIILLENNRNNKNDNNNNNNDKEESSSNNSNDNNIDNNEMTIKYNELFGEFKKLKDSLVEKDKDINVLEDNYKDRIEYLEQSIREKDRQLQLGVHNNQNQRETIKLDERVKSLVQRTLKSNRRKYNESQSIYKLSDQRYIVNSTPVEITIDENDKLLAKQSGALVSVPLESYFVKQEPFVTWERVLAILLGFFFAFYLFVKVYPFQISKDN